MASAHLNAQRTQSFEPRILTVPGLYGSGENHWQSRWEQDYPAIQRVDLGEWHDPRRNQWVNRLNLAIHNSARPVILVAHSLGCLATAWWAHYEQPAAGQIAGALLVAPPDVEGGDDDAREVDHRLRRFAPVPRDPLPFPSILVGSRNDPLCSLASARGLARDWGSWFADALWAGHINADSAIGDWPFGKALLRQLLGWHRRSGLDEAAGGPDEARAVSEVLQRPPASVPQGLVLSR